MQYIAVGHTDIGLSREVNQDAYSIQVAQIGSEQVVFTVLCDGVGGLKHGELSSATVARSFCSWFETEFPQMIRDGEVDYSAVLQEWVQRLEDLNRRILDYGLVRGLRTGTTIALLLVYAGTALAANIGDSRIYFLPKQEEPCLVSHDHTVAQREYELGHITREQIRTDKRSHILLQCIGSSAALHPEAAEITCAPGDAFCLCSDGFYRRLRDAEIASLTRDQRHAAEPLVKRDLQALVETVKSRNESDNITAVVVWTKE